VACFKATWQNLRTKAEEEYDTGYPGQDSNRELPEYEGSVLTATAQRTAIF
jgi:hypothetical protein